MTVVTEHNLVRIVVIAECQCGELFEAETEDIALDELLRHREIAEAPQP